MVLVLSISYTCSVTTQSYIDDMHWRCMFWNDALFMKSVFQRILNVLVNLYPAALIFLSGMTIYASQKEKGPSIQITHNKEEWLLWFMNNSPEEQKGSKLQKQWNISATVLKAFITFYIENNRSVGWDPNTTKTHTNMYFVAIFSI